MRIARRYRIRPAGTRLRGCGVPLPSARCDLHRGQGRRQGPGHRRRDRNRRWRRWIPQAAGTRRHRLGILCRPARFPQIPQGARRAVRHQRCPRGAEEGGRGGVPRISLAEVRGPSDEERLLACPDEGEEGGRVIDTLRRLQGTRPAAASGAVPPRLRRGGRHMPGCRRASRGCRARCPGVSGLPLLPPREAAHEQRPGTREQGDKAPQPRRAGLPVEEIPDKVRGRGAGGARRAVVEPQVGSRRNPWTRSWIGPSRHRIPLTRARRPSMPGGSSPSSLPIMGRRRRITSQRRFDSRGSDSLSTNIRHTTCGSVYN